MHKYNIYEGTDFLGLAVFLVLKPWGKMDLRNKTKNQTQALVLERGGPVVCIMRVVTNLITSSKEISALEFKLFFFFFGKSLEFKL